MNKTLKKTLSIILTVLMIVTAMPFAFAADIVASGECGADGDNLTWTLDSDGTLTISGTGAMAEYSSVNLPQYGDILPPWAGHKENIKKIVIEEGVTVLGLYAFHGHTAVKYVSIADTVTTFNGRVFDGCSAIESLLIPASVSILENTSFRDCSSLKKIVFLGKVDLDSNYAFDGCSELREIVFAKGATNNNAIATPFTNDAMNISETVIHFGGTQAEAEAAFAPIKEWDKIYSVATIHYIDGCNCSVCGEYHIVADDICVFCGYECFHENYTDSKCDTCGYECPHEGQNGSCEVCGANLGKLVIDVTDKSFVEIGNGYDYYDEDGYIITGTNQNASVNIFEETELTLSNLTLEILSFNNAPDNSVMNINLDGTTDISYVVLLTGEHLVFDGSETDIFKAPYFNTGGKPGSVTVNGGNIILDLVTEGNSPTMACTGGLTINGGTVTASNDYYVVTNPVTLNGGELNIISTATDSEAIRSDIIMNKGAFLTVSATSGILYWNANILKADGLTESDCFFVRYDTESEFVPVYDIRAALDGKTYAEIKIDTHEHSFENGKCVCDYECPHESYADSKCEVCGYECPHESYTDSKCEVCGYECPHESYTDGKCDACEAARADYTAFDAAVNELSELINHDRLLTNLKENYTENMRVYVSFVGNNRTEGEQNVVDNVTNTLNNLIASLKNNIEKGSAIRADFTYMKSMIDQINALIDNDPNNIIDSATDNYVGPTSYYNGNSHNVQFTQARYNSDMEEYHYEAQLESLLAGLKDGTMLKADYTAIDEAIKAVDEALENTTISEEMATELEDIKDQLDTLKEDENATMADVIELNERLEAIAETMDNCANGVHSFTKYEEETAPECGKAGKEVATCDNGCGETDEKEIPAFTHVDNDGDYECDHGCGHEFEKPEEPSDTCDHICHSNNALMKILWKIISFFQRLFGIQQYCDCGALHYEKAIFG